MKTAVAEVLDLAVKPDGTITARSERFMSQKPGEKYFVRWDLTRCPQSWTNIGRVLYAEPKAAWENIGGSIGPVSLGGGKYKFSDEFHPDGMLLAVILPENFDYIGVDESMPLPYGAKSVRGRLALLWRLDPTQQQIICGIGKEEGMDGSKAAERINAQLAALPQDQTISPIVLGGDAVGQMPQLSGDADGQVPEPLGDADGQVPESSGDGDSGGKGQTPLSEPNGAAGWLLESVRQVPAMRYAVAVVGLVAATAISSLLVFNNYPAAILGGTAVLIGMFLVRIFAASQPKNDPIAVTLHVNVILWTCVAAFMIIVALGLIRLGITMFPTNGSAKQMMPPQLTADAQKIRKIDTEIAARLANFERALAENEAVKWKTPTTYANVLWFLDNASELHPEFRSYRFVGLLSLLEEAVPDSEKESITVATEKARELERHRDRLKARDPNQLDKPPHEISEMYSQILPGLKLARWTTLDAYKSQSK